MWTVQHQPSRQEASEHENRHRFRCLAPTKILWININVDGSVPNVSTLENPRGETTKSFIRLPLSIVFHAEEQCRAYTVILYLMEQQVKINKDRRRQAAIE
mmetsp:Transcript_31741/g.74703  ORF Transcript_31741/g.74703 Transcript_31741/m.74703 type:complete len:101 (+) Transcript_31741:1691-1993(+)